MIYKIRVILDAKEDVFRDIAVEEDIQLEELHNAVAQAFGFDASEMAAFYNCDDNWNQQEQYSLFDMGEEETALMSETPMKDILNEEGTKLIYVYDFFNMWTFFVELASVESKSTEFSYPQLLFSFGVLPESPPEKEFNFETEDENDDLTMGFDDMESFDDMEADPENWY